MQDGSFFLTKSFFWDTAKGKPHFVFFPNQLWETWSIFSIWPLLPFSWAFYLHFATCANTLVLLCSKLPKQLLFSRSLWPKGGPQPDRGCNSKILFFGKRSYHYKLILDHIITNWFFYLVWFWIQMSEKLPIIVLFHSIITWNDFTPFPAGFGRILSKLLFFLTKEKRSPFPAGTAEPERYSFFVYINIKAVFHATAVDGNTKLSHFSIKPDFLLQTVKKKKQKKKRNCSGSDLYVR